MENIHDKMKDCDKRGLAAYLVLQLRVANVNLNAMMTKESLLMRARVGSGSTFSAGSPKGLMQCKDFLLFGTQRL